MSWPSDSRIVFDIPCWDTYNFSGVLSVFNVFFNPTLLYPSIELQTLSDIDLHLINIFCLSTIQDGWLNLNWWVSGQTNCLHVDAIKTLNHICRRANGTKSYDVIRLKNLRNLSACNHVDLWNGAISYERFWILLLTIHRSSCQTDISPQIV